MANHETKFNADRQRRILKDLADGQTRACAGARAGISERTFRNWMRRGATGEEPFAAFVAGVKKAERDAEAVAVGEIRKAGKKNWTAYAWWLERKYPQSWGKESDKIREALKLLKELSERPGNSDS